MSIKANKSPTLLEVWAEFHSYLRGKGAIPERWDRLVLEEMFDRWRLRKKGLYYAHEINWEDEIN
jgi:hypothetical protein